MERVLNGLGDAVLAFAVAHGDDGGAAVAQGGVHVVEVEVDVALLGDDFGDGRGGGGEDVVGRFEGAFKFEVGIDFDEAFVVDNHDCVDILAHLLGAGERFVDFAHAFEHEGDGDDADGEQPALFGDTSHDGAGTGTGTAAHTGGDEHHVEVVVEDSGDVGSRFFGGGLCNGGIVAGAAAAGGRRADEQLIGHRRRVESLLIGINYHKRHMLNALMEHVIDGIVAATAHTHHDDAVGVLLSIGAGGIFIEILSIFRSHNE